MTRATDGQFAGLTPYDDWTLRNAEGIHTMVQNDALYKVVSHNIQLIILR